MEPVRNRIVVPRRSRRLPVHAATEIAVSSTGRPPSQVRSTSVGGEHSQGTTYGRPPPRSTTQPSSTPSFVLTVPPNNALQRTETGGRLFCVFRALLRQSLSLSLSPLGDSSIRNFQHSSHEIVHSSLVCLGSRLFRCAEQHHVSPPSRIGVPLLYCRHCSHHALRHVGSFCPAVHRAQSRRLTTRSSEQRLAAGLPLAFHALFASLCR